LHGVHHALVHTGGAHHHKADDQVEQEEHRHQLREGLHQWIAKKALATRCGHDDEQHLKRQAQAQHTQRNAEERIGAGAAGGQQHGCQHHHPAHQGAHLTLGHAGLMACMALRAHIQPGHADEIEQEQRQHHGNETRYTDEAGDGVQVHANDLVARLKPLHQRQFLVEGGVVVQVDIAHQLQILLGDRHEDVGAHVALESRVIGLVEVVGVVVHPRVENGVGVRFHSLQVPLDHLLFELGPLGQHARSAHHLVALHGRGGENLLLGLSGNGVEAEHIDEPPQQRKGYYRRAAAHHRVISQRALCKPKEEVGPDQEDVQGNKRSRDGKRQ